ncbi:MAG: CpcT/CpeT family chromophore lyase [Rudaea sp.]|nr:CpcT/CpeT family chromophore lyase [Rudaea sp.]
MKTTIWVPALLVLMSGCQLPAIRSPGTVANTDAVARLDAALAGDYDNDEQVRQARAGVRAGSQVAVPHLREQWRLLEHDRDHSLWLWHWQSQDVQANATDWLYRIGASSAGRVVLTPYRAIDPAAVKIALADAKNFKFVAAQWAELAPCAMTGEWKNTQFSASADAVACSALLPGLGESASLLPLQLNLDGEMLHAATFADQARGSGAGIDARRLRWFSGWAAINGGGPKAKVVNQDWHTQNDLRLSSEGGRTPLHWRDGAASGYSLELVRITYAERKLSVLQLNVIEDASGQTIDYAWTNPEGKAIGVNLGWLQVGLTQVGIGAEWIR